MTQAEAYTTSETAKRTAWVAAAYAAARKDEILGALLAFFLGTFGAHWFYLGNNRLGFLYAAFFWTGIPSICGLVECFFMPGRVRAYNFAHAQELAARAGVGPWAVPVVPAALAMVCPACGQHVAGVAQFCTRCGASTATVPQVASI